MDEIMGFDKIKRFGYNYTKNLPYNHYFMPTPEIKIPEEGIVREHADLIAKKRREKLEKKEIKGATDLLKKDIADTFHNANIGIFSRKELVDYLPRIEKKI